MNLESLRPLADHLWQSTLFAAFAGLLTLAFGRNRARVRHGVWLAASCKFLIPLSLLISLGGHFAWMPRGPSAPTVAQSRMRVVANVANEVSQPFAGPPAMAPIIPTAPNSADLAPAVLLLIWACGFIGIACNWFVRWRRIRAVVRAAGPVDLGLPIQVLSCSTSLEPGIFGILRPALLLPADIARNLSAAQLKAVIAHELCHVRHRDNLAAAFQMCMETLYWFHPMVWWIGKRMVAERERACDEEVLQLGNQPRVYAEGILNVCRLYVESPLACVSGVTGSDLKKRIHGIVSGRTARDLSFARKAGLAAAGATCLALPLLIGVWNASLMRGQPAVSVHVLPAPTVRFRSVSITPCTTYWMARVESPSPGRLALTCENVEGLIRLAYLVPATGPETLITGSPAAWDDMEANRFTIDARADAHASLETMQGPMLQALLVDRFRLKIHGETRTVPMFNLTVAKGGPKLKREDASSCGTAWPRGALRPPPPPPPPGTDNCVSSRGANGQYTVRCPPVATPPVQRCASYVGGAGGGLGKYMTIEAEASSLPDFCRLLTGALGAPVVDKTGIAGTFHFHLEFAGHDTPGALGQLYAPLPEVLEKALGLKLERTTGPREFLVVDHVEKPH